MTDGVLPLHVAGEVLLLHPQRAVEWPLRRTLVVADTHFGKSALFREHGLAVPAGSDAHDRDRLSLLVRSTEARRLIILGDFLHGALAPDSPDARDLDAWSAALGGTEVHVIAGNHDRGVRRRWQPRVIWQDSDLLDPPFRFTHDADRLTGDEAGLFTLSGHIHPVVRMGAWRRPAPRIPIFWQRGQNLVLPAFGIFTGGYVVAPESSDRVFAVGPQGVVRFR